MADAARKRATYADLMAVPRHLVAEILGGVLQTHPRPAPRHALASSVLGGRIGRAFHEGDGGPGGWWILDEPEIHLLDGEAIVVPDLAGWRLERMPDLPDTAYFAVPPDWICEVLSPSTEADDRADKMPVYASAGVAHVWLLDPIVRTLEVFRLESRRWLLATTFKGDEAVRAEPFQEIELDMGALWRSPAPHR